MRVIRRATYVILMALGLYSCDVSEQTPNILLIVLDDFGYNDLAINNRSNSPTPHLDQLAREGLRFTRHYTESSCTASRVALLTGKSPTYAGAHPYLNGIDEEFVTLADALSEQGYTNYMLGKWHAGDAHEMSRPEHQGFHHWFGFMNQLYLKGPQGPDKYRRGKPTYRNPWLETESGERKRYRGHLTNLITDRALDVMRTQKNKWFIYLSYFAPHSPAEPAPNFAGRHSDDPAGQYQALKEQLDHSIGRILTHLRSSGALENTLIMVVSDNGGSARAWPSNKPFHGIKATYTEGGIRTPLLLSWPKHWPAGKVRDEPVMIIDLYPTIMAALGVEGPPGLEGHNLLEAAPQRLLRWYSHAHEKDRYSVLSRDGQWRLSCCDNDALSLRGEADFVDPHPNNRLQEEPEQAMAMRADMLAWIRQATEVTGLTRKDSQGSAHYSGQAFRRTPMGGTHTLGLVLRKSDGIAVANKETIVSQQGYIEINSDDEALQISIDGNTLSVPLPEEDCFTLFVSSIMAKDNMIFTHPSLTHIYLDGRLADSKSYRNIRLTAASPRNPLIVTTSNEKPLYQPRQANVELSTRALPAQEISQRSQTMKASYCAG